MNISQILKGDFSSISKPLHLPKNTIRSLKWQIEHFLYERQLDPGVHMVHIRNIGSKVCIGLYLSRPGLFIGPYGSTMDEIKTSLEEFLRSHSDTPWEVEFDLKEYDPWK